MRKFLLLVFSIVFFAAQAQVTISGSITETGTGEALPGVIIVLKSDPRIGSISNANGLFTLNIPANISLPAVITFSFIGYEIEEYTVKAPGEKIQVKLRLKAVEVGTVDIARERLKAKQKLAPLTVENFDLKAIRETPAVSFYDGLGQLKGVDITAASIGFKVINTRGFNSTSPVRSLQVIDGVDNQAPGLNFSLGNFLGSSELDVQSVDIIQGASSAYYGPNAFNGVISMTTKSPFTTPGLNILFKAGERNLIETAIRYADKKKYKSGQDKFGYKLNLYYMKAHDWEATNYAPVDHSRSKADNAGGYDAVNRYGDEFTTALQDYSDSANYYRIIPGLGTFYRPGYMEKDIVDYNSHNFKSNLALHYKLKEGTEFIMASNFGTGTTVYQGENRLSLKDILFFQNRFEVRKENKWFFQAYATNENSGNSYDAVLTAMMMQQTSKPDDKWAQTYYSYWYATVAPRVQSLDGYPKYQWPNPFDYKTADSVLRANHDKLEGWHKEAAAEANKGNPTFGYIDYYQPGTKEFDSLFKAITTNNISFTPGHYGSHFYDRSALYHARAEYIFNTKFGEIKSGGNFRMYIPDSRGTIFSDTGNYRIRNKEFGIYSGIEKKLNSDKVKLNFTARLDKNQNFSYNFSPALSAVYAYSPERIFRISLSSAIRNPTLLDQYLYYNVGAAILKGNINGFNHLMTVGSFKDVLNHQDTNYAKYFNIDPVQPEKVKTAEIGFRGTLFNRVYIDAGYYISLYKDFIGYKIGVDALFDNNNHPIYYQAYRVAANTKDQVTTQGFAVNVNYYFKKYFILGSNYTWNRLNQYTETDSIIPAFNTPEHKFNISIAGRDFEGKWLGMNFKGWGFNFNYKWVKGFIFEGSPQFTGFVPGYDALDGQVNYTYSKWKTTFKLGASNMLNRKFFQVYGGPYTGRLIYISALYNFVYDK